MKHSHQFLLDLSCIGRWGVAPSLTTRKPCAREGTSSAGWKSVSATTIRGSDTRSWDWVEASIWKDRRLTAQANGVKGDPWYTRLHRQDPASGLGRRTGEWGRGGGWSHEHRKKSMTPPADPD